MSTVERLLKNTGAIMLARGVQPILSTVLVIVIARIWSVEAYGKYTTVFYLLFIFQVVCSFGLNPLLTREVAKNRELANRHLNGGIVLGVPFSILSMLVMMSISHFMQYEHDVAMAVSIASISLIASALADCFEGVIAGNERIRTIAKVWTLEVILRSGLSILMVYMGYGLLSVVSVYVIARFITPLVYYILINRAIVRVRLDIDLEFTKGLLKKTYIFALILICATIFWRIDAVILPRMKNNIEVGLFGAAHRLFYFNHLMVVSFFTAFFPVISRLFAKQSEAFQIACKKSIQFLTILCLPLALFVTFFSKNIIFLFFKEKYIDAAPALIILMWALVLFAITEVFGYALLASNHQKKDLQVNFIALACKIFLNLILIPKYSYIGAVIATVLSIFIQLIIQFLYVSKTVITFQLNRLIMQGMRLGLAGGIMGLTVYLLRQNNLFVVFVISLCIYVLCLFLLKIFSKEDVSFLKNLLRSTLNRNKSSSA